MLQLPAGRSNFVSQDGMRFSTLEITGRAPRAFRAEQDQLHVHVKSNSERSRHLYIVAPNSNSPYTCEHVTRGVMRIHIPSLHLVFGFHQRKKSIQ